MIDGAGPLQFRVLGSLEVYAGGQALELGSRKPRTLLAFLLLHRNEVVSSDRLIEALWPDGPPPTATGSLHKYVSQLRSKLGRERVVRRHPGYLLRVADDELDLARFERLLAEARKTTSPQERTTTLRQALSLWQGEPLADLVYESFAQPAIAHVGELRLEAIEEQIFAELELGYHAALVGLLEELIAQHPVRERLREQLMLALYRSGRQAEALAVYQDARQAFVEELGIEPSRALHELQRRILNQEQALDLAKSDRPPGAAGPRRAERRRMTVLHADPFPAAAAVRLDPEVFEQRVRDALEHVRRAVERHGGSAVELGGDAVAGLFGLPRLHEDDAVRAVRAAFELRDGLGRELRLGIESGDVVVGGSARLDSLPIGPAVAVAARLAREAAHGEILIGEEARRSLRDAVDVEPVDAEREAQGVRVFRLVALRSRTSTLVQHPRSELVGRKRELALLEDAFATVVETRAPRLLTVVGPPGVGKSRLAAEFVNALGKRARVLRGRCLSYGEGITYWPVREAVGEAAGLRAEERPEQSLEKLRALTEGEDRADAIVDRVAGIIGLGPPTGAADESSWAVRRFFEALARERPLVVAFDDLHWAEPTFLGLVEHVVDHAQGASIVLLCLARPELLDLRPGWAGGQLNVTLLSLEPLEPAASGQLIESLLGGGAIDPAVVERVSELAGGNPLFVEEIVTMLVDDGFLRRDRDRWVAAVDLAEVHVPPTIQAVLAARLDRLPVDERAVLERAAVEGKIFHGGGVTALSPGGEQPRIPALLAALARQELILAHRALLPGSEGYAFRHQLIRDAAYEFVPKAARAELHEQFAQWLEAEAGARAHEYDEILGHHLEQAHRYRAQLGRKDERQRRLAERAAAKLVSAGRRARRRGDVSAANLLSRAAELLPAESPARIELLVDVGEALYNALDLVRSESILTEAIQLAERIGDVTLLARARLAYGILQAVGNLSFETEQVQNEAEGWIERLERSGDDIGLARGWYLLARLHLLRGRAAEMEPALERALEHAARAGAGDQEAHLLTELMLPCILGPTPAGQIIERSQKVVVRGKGSLIVEAHALRMRALARAMQGRIDDGRRLVVRTRAILDELGLAPLSTLGAAARIELLGGDIDAAERMLRQRYERSEQLGLAKTSGLMLHDLADVLCTQGRYDEAEQFARMSEERAGRNDLCDQFSWRRVKAKVLSARGQSGKAAELAREAMTLARQSDFYEWRADTLVDCATVLRDAGLPGEARPLAQEALELYELKGNVVLAPKARQLVEGLTSAALDLMP